MVQVKIAAYKGSAEVVRSIESLLEMGYGDMFSLVLAHGSVATDEIIAYSDFDGLLVVKDQFLNSPRYNEFRRKSERIIDAFDPLQHHGWFVVKESDLQNYDPRVLPPTVLEFARVIHPNKDRVLHLNLIQDTLDWKRPALNLLKSLELKTNKHFPPKGMFNLKSWLSELMLVPTLVYQAREKKGVFKKFSFEAMKPYYSDEAWKAIETSSRIRARWNYKSTPKLHLFVALKNKKGLKKFVRSQLAPSIPQELEYELNSGFVHSIHTLIQESRSLISKSN